MNSSADELFPLDDFERTWLDRIDIRSLEVDKQGRSRGGPGVLRFNSWQVRFAVPWERMLQEIVLELFNERPYRAVKLARELASEHPGFRDGRLMAGMLELVEGEPKRAALELIHGEDNRGRTGSTIGRICPRLRFRIRLHPLHLEPVYPNRYGLTVALATALLRLKLHDRVVEVLKAAQEDLGPSRAFKFLAGYARYRQGRFDNAAAILETSSPPSSDLSRLISLYYGLSLERTGHRDGAIFVLGRDLDPRVPANPWLMSVTGMVRAELCHREGYFWDAAKSLSCVEREELPEGRRERYIELREELDRHAEQSGGWEYLPRFDEKEYLVNQTVVPSQRDEPAGEEGI